MTTILVLEDDPAQLELYQAWFADSENRWLYCETYEQFQQRLTDEVTLIVLDWNLPDTDGLTVLKDIRRRSSTYVPVIFVSAREAELDVVEALQAGADDYVVKPARYYELSARISSLLRRYQIDSIAQYKPYKIDHESSSIYLHGELVPLTKREFDLVSYMFNNHGKLLSRVHLLEKIWRTASTLDTRTVDTHISRIRRKLKINPDNDWRIIAVYGWGYRLESVQTC